MHAYIKAKVFGGLDQAKNIEVSLLEGEVGDYASLESDVVLGGYLTIDEKNLPRKVFVLGEFYIAMLIKFLEVEHLEEFEIVDIGGRHFNLTVYILYLNYIINFNI